MRYRYPAALGASRLALVLIASALSACAATREPGWQGSNATPFGQAETLCTEQSRDVLESHRQRAFEQCMQGHGWTRE